VQNETILKNVILIYLSPRTKFKLSRIRLFIPPFTFITNNPMSDIS